MNEELKIKAENDLILSQQEKIKELEGIIHSSKKRKNWFLRIGSKMIFGSDLHKSVKKAMDGNFSKDNVSKIIVGVFHRFTRIGLFAIVPVLFLLVQIFILYQQDSKLGVQNIKLENQNKHIIEQSHLMESSKRSSMILMFDNVMKAIDDKIKNKENALGPKLISRISSLSHSIRPYYSMEDTSLSNNRYSYERGSLFNMLFSEDYLHPEDKQSILSGCNFDNMVLYKGQINNLCGWQKRKSSYNSEFLDNLNFRLSGALVEKMNFNKSSLDIIGKNNKFIDLKFNNCDIRIEDYQLILERCAFVNGKTIINTCSTGIKNLLFDGSWPPKNSKCDVSLYSDECQFKLSSSTFLNVLVSVNKQTVFNDCHFTRTYFYKNDIDHIEFKKCFINGLYSTYTYKDNKWYSGFNIDNDKILNMDSCILNERDAIALFKTNSDYDRIYKIGKVDIELYETFYPIIKGKMGINFEFEDYYLNPSEFSIGGQLYHREDNRNEQKVFSSPYCLITRK